MARKSETQNEEIKNEGGETAEIIAEADSKAEAGGTSSPASPDDEDLKDPGERRMPTVEEVAKFFADDPFTLLEAVVVIANSDRFRRNASLAAIAQHYQVEQTPMREWQARLDARQQRKDEATKAAE